MNKQRAVNPEETIPEVPGTVFLFRSCTGSLEYPGTENAVKEVLASLGIHGGNGPRPDLLFGLPSHLLGAHPQFSLAVTARNLAIVEKKGLDTFIFCNGCFGYNRELSHILLCTTPRTCRRPTTSSRNGDTDTRERHGYSTSRSSTTAPGQRSAQRSCGPSRAQGRRALRLPLPCPAVRDPRRGRLPHIPRKNHRGPGGRARVLPGAPGLLRLFRGPGVHPQGEPSSRTF